MLKFPASKPGIDLYTEQQTKTSKLTNDKIHEQFFQLSTDMLCIIGFDGRFKKISPYFERILGYEKNELISKSFFDFVLTEDLDSSAKEFNALKTGNSSLQFENRYCAKDGSIKWIVWRSETIQDENLIYALARDITCQKKIESEFKEQSIKLNELLKNKDSGLRYGQLLQEAIFHDPDTLNDIFPQSFIFHSPKDIVSGDFYWFEKIGNKAFVTCADATGHGVPGAILSVLGLDKLHQIIKSKGLKRPSNILERFNDKIFKALSKKKQGKKKVNDGIDVSLFSVDFKTKILEYAGANNPLYIIRNGNLIEMKPDKLTIGAKTDQMYTNNTIQLETGDMIYVFTDGYADQFGGEKGKRFMYRQFKNLLISISDKSTEAQKQILTQTIQNWMGQHEQTDDMCVIGVRIE